MIALTLTGPLPRSAEFRVESDIGPLRLSLAWPDTPPPAEGWPLLWVLDPVQAFMGTVAALRSCCHRSDATGIVPVVVAGAAPDGPGDSQPHAREAWCLGVNRVGMQQALVGILRERVAQALRAWLPHHRADTPLIAARDVLAGHSLSAVFALHTALAYPRHIAAVAAISPSLWHGTQDLLDQAERYVSASAPLRLLVAVGEYEEGLAPWERDRADSEEKAARRAARRMVTSARQFALDATAANDALHVAYLQLREADHATARVLSLPAMLRLCAPLSVPRH